MRKFGTLILLTRTCDKNPLLFPPTLALLEGEPTFNEAIEALNYSPKRKKKVVVNITPETVAYFGG